MKECKGGKKRKHRFTVTFIVNAAGKSESKSIVIWKSANLRCFKGIKKSDLPVEYFSQPKAWMTGDILEKVLCKLNKELRSKDRFVLFMDNAGCHPPNIIVILKLYSYLPIQHLCSNHLM